MGLVIGGGQSISQPIMGAACIDLVQCVTDAGAFGKLAHRILCSLDVADASTSGQQAPSCTNTAQFFSAQQRLS